MIVIALLGILVLTETAYKRIYLPRRASDYKITLIYVAKELRLLQFLCTLFIVLLNMRRLIEEPFGWMHIIYGFLFLELLIISFIQETQKDIITEHGIFTRSGNYDLDYIENYSWNLRAYMSFFTDQVRYDDLLLTMKPKNKLEAFRKGKTAYPLKLRIRKEDRAELENLLKNWSIL